MRTRAYDQVDDSKTTHAAGDRQGYLASVRVVFNERNARHKARRDAEHAKRKQLQRELSKLERTSLGQ